MPGPSLLPVPRPLSQTTLAHIIANNSKKHSIRFRRCQQLPRQLTAGRHQTSSEREEIFQEETILFIDEIHRFNKSQQVRKPSGLKPWDLSVKPVRSLYKGSGWG